MAHGLGSCGLRALERRLSSCGAWALLLCGMWDLPRPGPEPVSPALAGGFLTTEPGGKSPKSSILKKTESQKLRCKNQGIFYLYKAQKQAQVIHAARSEDLDHPRRGNYTPGRKDR